MTIAYKGGRQHFPRSSRKTLPASLQHYSTLVPVSALWVHAAETINLTGFDFTTDGPGGTGWSYTTGNRTFLVTGAGVTITGTRAEVAQMFKNFLRFVAGE